MKLENCVALVTGANRGIGRALVTELLARGARRIYVAARDLAQAEQVAAHDRARLVPLRLDVTRPDEIAAAAAAAPDVTVVFNNAGLLGAFDLLATPVAQLQRDFDTNFFGALAVTRAFLPALERAAGGAAIVNVLTVVSLAAMPALGGYSASKAAAFSMTQALRAQLRGKRIDVVAVFPGPVDTEMSRDIQLPKTAPAVVARAIIEGVERGDEDIAPDPMSAQIVAAWRAAPKDVERQFAAM